MDFSDPTRAITPTLDGPVLAALAAAGRPLTVGEIAELSVRGSEIGIRKCLNRLVQQGIVRAVEMGRNRVHEINREHLGAGIVNELGNLRLEFLRRLRAELGSWSPAPIASWLFGSTARGDGDDDSDVDLLIVRGLRRGEAAFSIERNANGRLSTLAPLFEAIADSKADKNNLWLQQGAESAWRDQLDQLRNLVHSWTGNSAQIVELTTNEMLDLRRRRSPLLEEVDRDGIALVERPMYRRMLQGS